MRFSGHFDEDDARFQTENKPMQLRDTDLNNVKSERKTERDQATILTLPTVELVDLNNLLDEYRACSGLHAAEIGSALEVSDEFNELEEDSFEVTDDKSLIKSYRITHFIGEGAFGQVYLCTHIKTKKTYAIKVQSKKMIDEAGLLKFARSE